MIEENKRRRLKGNRRRESVERKKNKRDSKKMRLE
jgi:hypothetical protein